MTFGDGEGSGGRWVGGPKPYLKGKESKSSGPQIRQMKYWLCLCLAVSPWASHLLYPNFTVLPHKRRECN